MMRLWRAGSGPWMVAGLAVTSVAVVLAASHLRDRVSEAPRALAAAVDRFEGHGDLDRYRRELEAIFAGHPPFAEAFREMLEPGRVRPGGERLAAERQSLLRLCRQGRMSLSASDLLLALLLVDHGELLAAARLLELMEREGRGSTASRRLLEDVYRGLGRGPDAPREPPGRERVATW